MVWLVLVNLNYKIYVIELNVLKDLFSEFRIWLKNIYIKVYKN